jgi:TfoX/Sxy family transcriptional regulator of competence genes
VEFTPSPAPLVAAFDAALPLEPGVVRRKMFGWPAAFVGGWMFASLHRESIVVRLPEDDLAELLLLPGAARFEPMPGRAMKGYGTLPRDLHEDGDAIRSWIGRAYRAAAALPPKG